MNTDSDVAIWTVSIPRAKVLRAPIRRLLFRECGFYQHRFRRSRFRECGFYENLRGRFLFRECKFCQPRFGLSRFGGGTGHILSFFVVSAGFTLVTRWPWCMYSEAPRGEGHARIQLVGVVLGQFCFFGYRARVARPPGVLTREEVWCDTFA